MTVRFDDFATAGYVKSRQA